MHGQLPPNYQQIRYWKLTGNLWMLIGVNVTAVALLVLFGLFFSWFAARFGQLHQFVITSGWLLGLLVGVIATLMLHELAHGLAMQAYGAQPKYGINWKSLLAYATAPGYAFSRNQYLAVGLAPLVSLSLLAMLGMVALGGTPVVWLLALCAALNGAGAGGDLWMMAIVASSPSDAYIIDERDGMRIFVPASKRIETGD
jgi:hypothetical protein